jgi:dTDP-4-dehydrorhamnose 3,5-epimerase
MHFSPLAVDGSWLVEPEPQPDERGLFARIWCAREFREHGLCASFVQSSVSFNDVAGTLRGMHYQAEPNGEVKLVRCTAGSIFDVIVDLREASKTYLKWCAATLSGENRSALYIPQGCAHGFITLEERSEVVYEISEFYHPESARGVRWNDPALAIQWPRAPARISARDAAYALLSPRHP